MFGAIPGPEIIEPPAIFNAPGNVIVMDPVFAYALPLVRGITMSAVPTPPNNWSFPDEPDKPSILTKMSLLRPVFGLISAPDKSAHVFGRKVGELSNRMLYS